MFIVVEKPTWRLEGALSLDCDLQRIWSVADFQFGKGVGHLLFPRNVKIEYSRRTGRIRHVYLNGIRLATMRPTDGLFSLSLIGAERLAGHPNRAKCIVTVKSDVGEFVAAGGDVFAVHVLHADKDVRAKDEVIVVDENKNVLAVGWAVLSSEEMTAFKRGVAVKVRRGTRE
jgi:predicted RNA-binding protein (TIGR00451 family)